MGKNQRLSFDPIFVIQIQLQMIDFMDLDPFFRSGSRKVKDLNLISSKNILRKRIFNFESDFYLILVYTISTLY